MIDYVQAAIDAADLRMVAELDASGSVRCAVVAHQGSGAGAVWTPTLAPASGEGEPPSLRRLVQAAAARVQAVEDTDDFLEWCEETGHDAADGRALDAYRDLVALADTLRRLLGTAAYRALLAGLAVDQAVTRARGGAGSPPAGS